MLKYILEPSAYGNHENINILNRGNGVELFENGERLKLSEDTEEFCSESKLKDFCRLYNLDFPTWPPKNFLKVYSALLPTDYDFSQISWADVMGSKRFSNELKALGAQLEEPFKTFDLDTSYWHNHYSKYEENLFHAMSPCKVDRVKYDEFYAEASGSQKKILQSFMPDKDGFCKPSVYSGTHTITGRLRVIDGPDILTLKKEYRSMFVSKHGDKGKIVYLDYSSLEPRVLLCMRDISSSIGSVPQDVYAKMLSDLNLSDKIPRAAAKLAILSIIYGQGEENTAKSLSKYIEHPHDFLEAVVDYFGIESLKEKLATDLLKSNGKFILNYFGRPIFCEDTKPYALLNYYVQSTAVDITLLGFMNIISRLKAKSLSDMISPNFILHDALFLDIHEDAYHVIPKLLSLGSNHILGFENINFWLRTEETT